MAERNSENDGMIFGFALIGAAVCLIMFVFYALICFAAIVLTIVAFCALDRDITICKWTITPKEARIFLSCGLAGLIGLPMFVIFCSALLHRQVPADWWGYILLGGYSFGALGLGSLIAEEEQKQQASAFLTLQSPPSDDPPALTSPPAEPFQFATWDDVENGR